MTLYMTGYGFCCNSYPYRSNEEAYVISQSPELGGFAYYNPDDKYFDDSDHQTRGFRCVCRQIKNFRRVK